MLTKAYFLHQVVFTCIRHMFLSVLSNHYVYITLYVKLSMLISSNLNKYVLINILVPKFIVFVTALLVLT